MGDQEALRRIIGMPQGHTGVAMIGLGHPADRPLGPPVTLKRRPFDEVVHRGRW